MPRPERKVQRSRPGPARGEGDQSIRLLIDGELTEPLSDEEWGFLLLQGQVGQIRRVLGERARQTEQMTKAARTIRNLRATQGRPVVGESEPAGRMGPSEGHRRYALSRLLALEADTDERVAGFRDAHLAGYPDRTLPWEEIGDWIAARAEADGAATTFALVALPPGATTVPGPEGLRVEDSAPLSDLRIEGALQARMLSFGLPGSKWVQRVAVRTGGVLDELWHLCAHLVRRYGWKEDQAAVFVLSGVTPYMPGIAFETVYRDDYPAASRITLVIDPVVAPQEVMARYSRLRQQMLPGRYRPLSDKHLRLAVFAAEHRPSGATWAKLMELWNQEHPEETYTQATVFARDCSLARKRLLQPRLDPDGLLELVADEQGREE
jgi:hypothetical protein